MGNRKLKYTLLYILKMNLMSACKYNTYLLMIINMNITIS